MTIREHDVIELGRRVALYLHVDNELPTGARVVALSCRFVDPFAVTCVR